ncbi:hypothetical protein ACIQCM_07005 [Pseudarthrobacter sp. NPDC092439]|uniref:MmyB family transcriptional regulator n=1 Tax=unclassified Pseudarthrobacter TaxID=2647000 RepID=UPI00382DF0E1
MRTTANGSTSLSTEPGLEVARRCGRRAGELSMRSEEFRTRRAAHNVRRHCAGTKFFHHPIAGTLELNYQVLGLEEDPGHTLTVYPATPGSPSEEALQLLATRAATEKVAGYASPLKQ